MANYLVTGGCGFIGSHLVDSLLKDGHCVRILDDLSTGKRENIPPGAEFVKGNINDKKTIKRCMKGVNGCFHLAAISLVHNRNEPWGATHQVNLAGSVNILDAARVNKTPVVYGSSAAVYGDNADIPLKESSAARPLSAYGADKLGLELHARIASLVYGVPTAGMRMFNVYGPRQNPASPYSGVISTFLDHLLNDEVLTVFGDGEQTRDFIYVSDAVHFIRKAMDNISTTPTLFNVCSGESVTINRLAKTLISITGRRSSVKHCSFSQRELLVSVGDSGYARQMLGVSAKVSLINGLQALIGNMLEGQASSKNPRLASSDKWLTG